MKHDILVLFVFSIFVTFRNFPCCEPGYRKIITCFRAIVFAKKSLAIQISNSSLVAQISDSCGVRTHSQNGALSRRLGLLGQSVLFDSLQPCILSVNWQVK